MTRSTYLLIVFALLTASASAQLSDPVIEPLGSVLAGRDVFGLSTSGLRVYAAAGSEGVYVYNTASATPEWEYLGLRGLDCRSIAVSPFDANMILVAAAATTDSARGMVIRSDDGGSTWYPSEAGMDTTLIGRPLEVVFSPQNQSMVVALFGGATPYVSDDRGYSWYAIDAAAPFTVNDVEFDSRDPGLMYAAGRHAALGPVVMKSTDGGINWSGRQVGIGGDTMVNAIAVDANNRDRIIGGAGSHLILSTDASETFSIAGRDEAVNFTDVAWDATDTNVAFALGATGTIMAGTRLAYSNDRGATWTMYSTPSRTAVAQRAVTSPAFERSMIFSTAELTSGTAGGVFRFGPRTPTAVPPALNVAQRAWFQGGGYHMAFERPVAWRIYDGAGRFLRSGISANGEEIIRLDGFPAGNYWLVTGTGDCVRGIVE